MKTLGRIITTVIGIYVAILIPAGIFCYHLYTSGSSSYEESIAEYSVDNLRNERGRLRGAVKDLKKGISHRDKEIEYRDKKEQKKNFKETNINNLVLEIAQFGKQISLYDDQLVIVQAKIKGGDGKSIFSKHFYGNRIDPVAQNRFFEVS